MAYSVPCFHSQRSTTSLSKDTPSDKYGLVDSDDDSSLVVGTRKAPPVDSSIQTLMAKLFYKTPKRESDHPKLSTRMSSTKIPVVPAKSNSSTIVF